MLSSSEKTENLSLACMLFYRFFIGEPSLPLWQDFAKIKQMQWFMDDALPQEISCFENLQKSLDIPIEDIILDYNQLFIGPDMLKAAPWASVYLSDKGQIFGEENSHAKAFYDKYKMEIPQKLNEPLDHIAFEFQFIHCILSHYQLSDEAAKEFIKRDLKDFLQNHFLPWAPLFLENVKKHAQTHFYQNIAELASFTVKRLQKIT